MILTDSQLKIIADRGRALPDAVLAPLVIGAVLGALQAPAPVEPKQVSAQPERSTPRVFKKTEATLKAIVSHIEANPGAKMGEIVKSLRVNRSWARIIVVRAMQDGLVQRRGERNETQYFPAKPSHIETPKPAVLLTEQRIDGENKQRIVQVVRRRVPERGAALDTPQWRAEAIVTYVRLNPGARRGDFVGLLGGDKNKFQEAMLLAKASGEVEARGRLNGTRYYPRGYVNGTGAPQVNTGAA